MRLEQRIAALERAHEPGDGRVLPIAVDDDTPQTAIDTMRAAGIEVYRWSDAPEAFI